MAGGECPNLEKSSTLNLFIFFPILFYLALRFRFLYLNISMYQYVQHVGSAVVVFEVLYK